MSFVPSREVDGKGRTVLHIAALWGDLTGVEIALEMGADPNVFDAGKSTPLELARQGLRQQGWDWRAGYYHLVVAALVEGEKRVAATRHVRRLEGQSDEGE